MPSDLEFAYETPRLYVSIASRAPLTPDELGTLATLLSRPVTHHLPPSMQYPGTYGDIADWVADRLDEARVYWVRDRTDARLIGAVLLHEDTETDPRTLHLGYFLGQQSWGQGLASELLAGLVQSLRQCDNAVIVAGVDPDNTASARVLEKVGFSRLRASPDAVQLFFELHLPG
jgi:RimJ/RimL family protein N-acetyltransferase